MSCIRLGSKRFARIAVTISNNRPGRWTNAALPLALIIYLLIESLLPMLNTIHVVQWHDAH